MVSIIKQVSHMEEEKAFLDESLDECTAGCAYYLVVGQILHMSCDSSTSLHQ